MTISKHWSLRPESLCSHFQRKATAIRMKIRATPSTALFWLDSILHVTPSLRNGRVKFTSNTVSISTRWCLELIFGLWFLLVPIEEFSNFFIYIYFYRFICIKRNLNFRNLSHPIWRRVEVDTLRPWRFSCDVPSSDIVNYICGWSVVHILHYQRIWSGYFHDIYDHSANILLVPIVHFIWTFTELTFLGWGVCCICSCLLPYKEKRIRLEI